MALKFSGYLMHRWICAMYLKYLYNMIITMSNNEKLSHKQIMGPFWKKICLPLNHQFTFVLCFRFIAQKHHSRFSVENFMKLS